MESDNHLISYKAILWFFKENYTIEPNSVSCKIWKEEANTIYKMLYQKGFVSIDEVLKFFDKHKIITEYNYWPISHTEYVYNLQLWTYEFDYDILKCLTFSDYVTGKESEESKDSQIINEFIEPLAKIVTDTYAEHKDNNINKFRCSVIIDKLRLEEQKNYRINSKYFTTSKRRWNCNCWSSK